MPERIDPKWRPPLLLVLSGVLGAVLCAPLAGLVALRLMSGSLGFRLSAILIGAVILLITVILGMLLWRLLLRPIRALAARAAAVETGGTVATEPLPHYGTRELRELGQSVLDMASTLQNREATIRSYTDHVTHELKTPITAIKGASEMLGDGPLSPQDARLVATITAATERMDDLLDALRQIAAAREPTHRGTCRLDGLMPDFRANFPGMTFAVEGGNVVLPLDGSGMTMVLHHLCSNALRHGATEMHLSGAGSDRMPQLTIRDNGTGISSGNRAHIFQPFFTTQRENGGTGMGLPIVQTLLNAHGAEIDLIESDCGAAFLIRFSNQR